MSWPLRDDFRSGAPIAQVPAEWFNTVAKILNYLEGAGCKIYKTATPDKGSPWRISVPASGGGSAALSDEAPLQDGEGGDSGESEEAARADHTHPLNVPETGTPEKDGAASRGDDATYARSDHVHPLNVDNTIIPQGVASTGASGTSSSYARADHRHAGVTVAGTTDTPSDVAPGADVEEGSAGTAASRVYANWDHKHKLNVGSVIPDADSSAGSAGTGEVYARNDHRHKLNAPTAGGGDGSDYPGDIIVDTEGEVSSGHIGSSDKYARADHDHRCDGCGSGEFERPDDPVNPLVLGQDSEGTSDNAVTTAYNATAEGAAGVSIWVCTRIRYNHSATTPMLYAYMSKLTFPAGIAPAVTGQTRFVVDAPVKVTIVPAT